MTQAVSYIRPAWSGISLTTTWTVSFLQYQFFMHLDIGGHVSLFTTLTSVKDLDCQMARVMSNSVIPSANWLHTCRYVGCIYFIFLWIPQVIWFCSIINEYTPLINKSTTQIKPPMTGLLALALYQALLRKMNCSWRNPTAMCTRWRSPSLWMAGINQAPD